MVISSLWSLPISLSAFAIAVVVILICGVRITAVADRLAVSTKLGGAVVGGLFLGATTSLPGLMTSLTAAAGGHAELAVSNALGGIAAQTAFLGIADMAYRKANLEHAAASEATLMQSTLLLILLTLPIIAWSGPEISLVSIHPATPASVLAYLFGMRLVSRAHQQPMWHPRLTAETSPETASTDHQRDRSLGTLWLQFIVFAFLLGSAGWTLTQAGVSLSHHTGISETLIGSFLTAISTSLPELIVAVTAVKRGALSLAVGDIIGGNAFDTLLIAMSDVAYRQGSIYHAFTHRQLLSIATTLLLTSILLMGLLRREKHGIANIGFESFLVLMLYIAFSVFLVVSP